MAERTLRINVVVNSQAGERNVRNLNQSLGSTQAAAAGAGAALGGMVLRIGGLAAIGEGLRRVASMSIDMNRTLETATLRFSGMMGSAERAEAHVRSLFTFAQRTPFATEPVIEASRLMQLFGGDALNTEANLRMVGDAAAASGQPIEALGMWTGRLYTALESGAPIGEATARLMEMGVIAPDVVMQLRDMNTAGVDAEATWRVFTEAMGEHAGQSEMLAETMDGLTSSLIDNISILAGKVGEKPFQAVKSVIGEINERVGEANEVWDLWAGLIDEASTEIFQAGRMSEGFTRKLFMTTSQLKDYNEAMALSADITRELASDVTPVLTLEVTSAAEALAAFEEESVRITAATESMRAETDRATEAFLRLRAAEDDLLVTAPQVRLTWEQMITPGRELGEEVLPTLEGKTIDLSDAMLYGPSSAANAATGFGAAVLAEFGGDGRATKSIGEFVTAIVDGEGSALGRVSGGLFANLLDWGTWGNTIRQIIGGIGGWLDSLIEGIFGVSNAFSGGTSGGGFGNTSTTAGKVEAGTAIAGNIATAVQEGQEGNTGASVLAGGAAGAQLGFQTGGPWGALIGAGVGALATWLANKGRNNNPQFDPELVSERLRNTGPPEEGEGQFTPLATGGIVTRPLTALLGEREPEAVIPLSRLGGLGVTVNMSFNGFSGSQRDAERVADIVDARIMKRLGNQRVLAGVV